MKVKQDFEFSLEHEAETATVLELKRKFYKAHTDKYKKPGWARHALRGMEPAALTLNPPLVIDPSDVFSIDTWVAIYPYARTIYFVKVEQNIHAPLRGPHAAKLWIQVYGGSSHRVGRFEWLGTAQFENVFHDEEKLRVSLRKAIRLREYWCDETTEDISIPLDPPELEGSRGLV